eukprot:SM000228S07368  [mRNA]  locus=s228:1835:3957:+ [translate_table: standard]
MPRQWVPQVLAGVLLQARAFQSEAAAAGVPMEPAVALLRAWRPYRMAHKATWWEAMALPADVNPEKELEFRATVRGLASGSLDLLRAAISGGSFTPLFSLQVYAHIIGMLELNNLAVVVPSPVEDYFLSMESLPPPEKAAARTALAPLLDVLGDDFGEPCEGMTTFCCLSVARQLLLRGRTAFYVLQSCANHSCVPNAHAFKRVEVRQLLNLSYGYGLEMPQAAQRAASLYLDSGVVAGPRWAGNAAGAAAHCGWRGGEQPPQRSLSPITSRTVYTMLAELDHVTISYIDESAPWHERQAELADYGFACHCTRCEREVVVAV